jgi:hypothetical protein
MSYAVMSCPQGVSAAADVHRSEKLESGWSQIEHGMHAGPQSGHTVRLLAANGAVTPSKPTGVS